MRASVPVNAEIQLFAEIAEFEIVIIGDVIGRQISDRAIQIYRGGRELCGLLFGLSGLELAADLGIRRAGLELDALRALIPRYLKLLFAASEDLRDVTELE